MAVVRSYIAGRWFAPWRWKSRWLIVSLVLAYPISFGPACWLAVEMDRAGAAVLGVRGLHVAEVVYQPILQFALSAPEPAFEVVDYYVTLFTWELAIHFSVKNCRFVVLHTAEDCQADANDQ